MKYFCLGLKKHLNVLTKSGQICISKTHIFLLAYSTFKPNFTQRLPTIQYKLD